MGVKTPIVALTANALESDKKLFFQAGIDDFQSKVYTEILAYKHIFIDSNITGFGLRRTGFEDHGLFDHPTIPDIKSFIVHNV